MRKLSLFWMVLFCLPAFADERLFFVGDDGKVYELSQSQGPRSMLGFGTPSGGGKPEWKVADPASLAGPQWEPKSNTRITPANTVEMDLSGSGHFADSGLLPPPNGMTYKAAALDSQGNLAVQLGGSGKGFNYKMANPAKPILAFKMEWAPGPFPTDVVALKAAPNSSDLLAVGKDGSLYRINPATQSKRSFDWTKVPGADGLDSLTVVNDQVFVHGPNGKLMHVENPASPAISVKAVALPPGAHQDPMFVTNHEPVSKIQNVSATRVRASTAPAPAVVAHAPAPASVASPAPSTPAAPAAPSPKSQGVKAPELIADDLQKLKGGEELDAFRNGIDSVMNDDLALKTWKGENYKLIGRDKEADQTIDVLARIKGSNAALLGEPGTGKTTVAEIIAQRMLDNTIPAGSAFDGLRNGVVVQTTAGKISSLAKSNDAQSQQQAMEQFLKGLKKAETELGRPIILYIDEMHTLSEAQLQALKPYMDSSSKGIKFIGSTTNNEFGRLIKDDDAMRRRLGAVNVPEFSEEMTAKVLKEGWVPQLEKRYNIKISDDALMAAIREAHVYVPTSHRPEGPFKLLQAVAVDQHRAAQGAAVVMQPKAVYDHIVKALDSPLNPYDRKEFREGIDKLRNDMREAVVDQERVTDAMVDLWEDVNKGIGKKSHRTMLVAGPTGAGKTFSAQTFAKKALGSDDRMLEVDMSKYSTGGHSLNTLIGAPNGVTSSDKTSGLLPEFLDGRGRGQNVIVLNEIDKASPEALQAIMEMLDTGKLQAGNGKTYHLGKSLIVITTNKGDEFIYPRGRAGALSRKELKERIAGITDNAVRGYFMQPDPNDLYDTSKQAPASVLQRIDRAVPAAPPSAEGAAKIAEQEADRLSAETSRKFGYSVKLTPEAASQLVAGYYVPENGAREVNRQAENLVDEAVKKVEEASGALPTGATITVDLQKGDKPNFQAHVDGHPPVATWEAPRAMVIENPMADPATREALNSLEERLGKHVFGQPDMVEAAARALRAKAMNVQDPKPARMLALGPTGTGKTEIFKAVAKEKYGNASRMIAFDMGKVKWDGDLSNIFGSATGIKGSGTMSPFEKFLNDFPEGGVIVFDEIGNMGSAAGGAHHEGASSKEDLLKKAFYSMLDEGKWTNAHGKTYSLQKYTLGFTSNEGQEIFNDLPADDLRLAAWKKGKNSSNLRAILKKHGWPEALLARFGGNIALSKPLLENERVEIAKKMADRTVSQLAGQHKFQSVEYDPKFFDTAANSFFSHEEGGRKLGDLGEFDMTDLMSKAAFDIGDPKELAESKMKFQLIDNYTGKTSHPAYGAPDRDVKLVLEVETPNGKRIFQSDVTERAAERRLVSKVESAATAYHEAAHAVVNDPRLTGQKLEHVTIKGQGGFGGYARYGSVSKQAYSRENVVALIGKMLAGMKAEEKLGFPPNSGWTSDLEEARKIAERAIGEMGLGKDPLSMATKNGKANMATAEAQKEIAALLEEGSKFADDRLTRDWPEVQKVAKELYRKKFLEGPDYDRVVLNSRMDRIAKMRSEGRSEADIIRLTGGLDGSQVESGSKISRSGRVRPDKACAAGFAGLKP